MNIKANHYESSDSAVVKIKDIMVMDTSIPELDTTKTDGCKFEVLRMHMEAARTYWLNAFDTCDLHELRTAATKAVIELLRGLEKTAKVKSAKESEVK